MKVTAQDLQHHYEGLSDDELLAVTREGLSEAARQCYDQEMQRRQLAPEEAADEDDEEPLVEEPVPGETDPRLSDNPVLVAVFGHLEEAKLAQSVLESAEIGSELRGFEVLVSESHAEQASELLLPLLGETNKGLVRTWIEEVWNHGQDADYDELETAAMVADVRGKLPGLQVVIEDIIAEGDRVAARLSLSASQNDSTVIRTGMTFVRLNTGRIVEAWYNLDPL